jgi:hypothetical protein
MTETRFTWRWLIVIALVGIGMGLTVGLTAGWILFPNIGSSSIDGLSATAQNDYIVLVANTYAYDRNGDRAKQRLAQLREPQIENRVEQLAKALAVRKDSSAAYVADLALALGSDDSSLRVMAETIANDSFTEPDNAEPTKVARSDDNLNVPAGSSDDASGEPDQAQPEPTAKKKRAKPTAPPEPTTEPEPEPTDVPAPVEPTAVPPTVPPQATAVPTALPQAAPLFPDFRPAWKDLWWDDINFVPAQVAAGQQYFRLVSALYCDWKDQRNACPDLPGGTDGHSIYIMVVDEGGNCIETELRDQLNDGSMHPLTPDMMKDVPYPWNNLPCRRDYEKEMYGEGNDIWVPGLPSDRINGLCLCNKTAVDGQNILKGHAHVRYFLIFQRTTR